jgi:ABC-2 type transport system permease protein
LKILNTITRMAAIADKEWIQIRRDFRSLYQALIIPAFLVLLFGYALNVDVTHVKFGVCDQDRSFFARQYIERFVHTEYLSLTTYIDNYRDIDFLLDSGAIVMAIVIPPDFEKRFKAGKFAEVQLLVDGSDSTSAVIATGYMKAITYQFNADLHERQLRAFGITDLKLPVSISSRIWYNSELKSKNFIIPGFLGLVIALISALITSLTMSREWERGTMETLITTPVRGYEVVLGKLIPYLIIGMFNIVCVLAIGYFVFGVPFRGSFIELSVISLIFLMGSCCLGIFISTATRVQVLSIQIAIISTWLPSFILSDFIFPIKGMPVVVQAITYIIPAKYMISVLKGIALRGVGYSVLMVQICFLTLFSFAMLALSIKKFRVTLPGK